MTERRTTITRTWRPAGAPARRQDDFEQIDGMPVEPAPPPTRRIDLDAPPRAERRGIGRRLENWGAWANARGSRGPDCMTGAICESLRRSELGDVWSGHQVSDRIDPLDAARIQAAFAKLDQQHRSILHWTYIAGERDRVVAKLCGFPRLELEERLIEAQSAVESVADEDARKLR